MLTSFVWLLIVNVGTRKLNAFHYRSKPHLFTLSASSRAINPNAADVSSLDPLEQSMQTLGYTDSTRLSIQEKLQHVGLSDSSELATFASDFRERPEVFSSLLQSDFGFDPVSAHRTRAAVMHLLSREPTQVKVIERNMPDDLSGVQDESLMPPTHNGVPKQEVTNGVPKQEVTIDSTEHNNHHDSTIKAPLFKSVVVNEKARRRRAKDSDSQKHEYGLPRNYRSVYTQLGHELDDFLTFMTKPSTLSQDPPIRMATANVYMRHAKLFLGWCFAQQQHSRLEKSTVSLFDIVPNKEKESADDFLEFILWLRTNRDISVSYEANVLRGLIKLLKFRFASESLTDTSYGEKSFEDIPIIRELRKLHRDANKRQTLSPRSSDEEKKWLSWPEFVAVIQGLKTDLLQLLDQYENEGPTQQQIKEVADHPHTLLQRKIATHYQHYLILAFLCCVPDRQRTIRELELNRSFIRDKQRNGWIIKHGPDDYKTGKTYGDRPPLVLSPELVPAIDDFLEHWRCCLAPKTEHLFVQPRTGNPLTQDSVYQIVSRSCYKYSGKKTNPHLLRDMIVTHVRESDASEKQLEALALYMGHSIHMQRTSYDRRTLTKKVAPAVELLQSVNRLDDGNDGQ